MKRMLSILAIMVACTAVHAQQKVNAVARFRTESIQIGKLKQGVPGVATFVVTNTGKSPLLIERTMPSCGCTAAEFTQTPIAPGGTGTIKATYNAAAVGTFSKTVSVKFAGYQDIVALNISGEVEAAKNNQQTP